MSRASAAILFCALCFPVFAHERIVALEGHGTIEVVPDIINIEISVSGHDRRNAAKAKSQVDATSSKAVASLIANGVREADIFSSSMSLEGNYSPPLQRHSQERITGRASRTGRCERLCNCS